MREVEVLSCARLAGMPLLLGAATQEELQSYPESVATTCSMRERRAMLQWQALGAHASHGPTFCKPSSQAINKHVNDPSS